MKNHRTGLLLAGIFMFAASVPALAQKKADGEKAREMTQEQEEMAAEEAAGGIDAAAKGEGAEKVRTRLMEQFNVKEDRIRTMREEDGMSYGEIALTLSLAKGMEGGITEENISRITEMRQGEPRAGWGKIAKELGQKLGPAISQSRKMSAEMREERKDGSMGGKMKDKKAGEMKKKSMKKKKNMMKKMEKQHERGMMDHGEHMKPMGGKGKGGK